MKTNILKTIAIALLASASVPVMANKARKATVKQVLQPAVTYLGTEGNSTLFSVKLGNTTPIKFVLTLTDAEGNRMYSHDFETTNFSKVFKVVAEQSDIDPMGLTFHFNVLSTGEAHEFKVSTSTEVIEEVKVAKL